MSMLQIDRKAVTEEDAKAVLSNTYALSDPLGTPTIFLNPDSFSPTLLEYAPPWMRKAFHNTAYNHTRQDQIRGIIQDFFDAGHFDHLSDEEHERVARVLEETVPELSQLIGSARILHEEPRTTMRGHLNDRLKAHHFAPVPEEFKAPFRSVIITPRSAWTPEDIPAYLIGSYQGSENAAGMPGFGAQYQFNSVWHEIGHGTGAAEPQTEMMAALVAKQAFEDTRFLSVQADLRAIRSVFRHSILRDDPNSISANGQINGQVREREKYGWPMAEVNDYVQGLPVDMVDALSEDDIKSIRFRRFDHIGDTLKTAADILKYEDPEGYETKDLHSLREAALYLAEKRSTPEEHAQIYERLALACERVLIGEEAYENAGDYECEQRFMTFQADEFSPV